MDLEHFLSYFCFLESLHKIYMHGDLCSEWKFENRPGICFPVSVLIMRTLIAKLCELLGKQYMEKTSVRYLTETGNRELLYGIFTQS
jgi:hypothetical protein